MNEVKQRVVKTDRTGVAPNGAVVEEQTKSVKSQTNPKTTVANVVWYLFGLVAILLAIRFVLKLTGANPTNGFVDFIYSITGFLSAPFDSIFGVAETSGRVITSVFEPSILVAIAVYGLVAWGIVKLLTLNETDRV